MQSTSKVPQSLLHLAPSTYSMLLHFWLTRPLGLLIFHDLLGGV